MWERTSPQWQVWVPVYPADAEKDCAYIFDAKLQKVLALVYTRCVLGQLWWPAPR